MTRSTHRLADAVPGTVPMLGPAASRAERPRGVRVRRLPANRRLVIGAERAGRRMAAMHCLVEVDVTAARTFLAMSGEPLSFTAFVAASVAWCAATHPEVHAYRTWGGRLAVHRHVDVAVLIEVATPQGLFALPHVLHDADVREVRDLSAEIRAVKDDYTPTGTGRLFDRLAPALTLVPGLVRLMYAVLARSVRLRQRIGTVLVTSVGLSGAGGAFGIAPPTLAPLQVVVGGIAERSRLSGNLVERREVLDLTITFDHDVVDGAPAARFVAELRRVIEDAAVLC